MSAPDLRLGEMLTNLELEELEELRALGVELTPPPSITDAERDAFASQLLWALGIVEQDQARFVEALGAELNRIRMRYSARIDSCERRAKRLRDAVHVLAAEADFGPKKKSRSVGHGVYGVRTVPEKIAIVDAPVLVAFAENSAPELLREKIVRDVPHANVKEYLKKTGDVPPGCEVTAEYQEPFCRTEGA